MNRSVILLCLTVGALACSHDKFALKTNPQFIYDDYPQSRLLADSPTGKLRIYMHILTKNGQLQPATQDKVPEENLYLLQKLLDISSKYWYRALEVVQLSQLTFPQVDKDNVTHAQPRCGGTIVPKQLCTTGVIADYGVIARTTVVKQDPNYTVWNMNSTACAFLKTNRRPIWGTIIVKNDYLTLVNSKNFLFQNAVYYINHEMVHILGFSALLYQTWPSKQLKLDKNETNYYFNSPKLKELIENQFSCSKNNTTNKGVPLENQDGTQKSSHLQKKVFGDELMTAIQNENPFISKFTLAWFVETGWYEKYNQTMAVEYFGWGYEKGCDFFDRNNCNFAQFCHSFDIGCTFTGSAIAHCTENLMTDRCYIMEPYSNGVCFYPKTKSSPDRTVRTLLKREEIGMSSSCFQFQSVNATSQTPEAEQKVRCFISLCSMDYKQINVLVSGVTRNCSSRSDSLDFTSYGDVPAGQLRCPDNIFAYCSTRLNCFADSEGKVCENQGICIKNICVCGKENSLNLVQNEKCGSNLVISPNSYVGVGRPRNSSDPDLNSTITAMFYWEEFSNNCNMGSISPFFYDVLTNSCQRCDLHFNCVQGCNREGCFVKPDLKNVFN